MNRLKTLVKIIISLLILYFVFTKVNSDEVLSVLRKIKPLPLFAAILVFIASQYISSLRLNKFWSAIGLKLSHTYNWRLYLLGMYYNLLLPGGIGGDGYKILLLSKSHVISKKKLFEAVIFDRLIGLVALLILLLIGISLINPFKYAVYLPVLIGPGFLIYRFILQKWFPFYDKSLVITLALSLIIQILQLFCAFLILISLGFGEGILAYLSVFLLSSIAAVLPITFGGAGARELTFLYSAKYFNIDVNAAISLSLVFYLITVLVSLSGIYFSFKQKIE